MALAEQLDDAPMQAAHLGSLGLVYHMQGDYRPANSYYQRALEIVEQVGNLPEQGRLWNNIGEVCAMLGHPDDALACYLRSIALLERVGLPDDAEPRRHLAELRGQVADADWPNLEATARTSVANPAWRPRYLSPACPTLNYAIMLVD